MIAEVHTFGTLANSRFENVKVRMSEIMEATREELEKELMVLKMNGTLVGFQLFELTEEMFYKANWQQKADALVAEWWDKESYIGTPPGVSKGLTDQ